MLTVSQIQRLNSMSLLHHGLSFVRSFKMVDPKHTNTAKRKIKIANDLPGGGTRAEEVGHRLADAVLLDFSCRTSASYVALFSLRP